MTTEKHVHDRKDPACLEVFARLSEYIDGELDPADCSHIEAHIADCPPCIDFLRSLKQCVQASRAIEESEECPPVPPEFEARLKQAWRDALQRRAHA
jgi:anti-sigma factor RsiW